MWALGNVLGRTVEWGFVGTLGGAGVATLERYLKLLEGKRPRLSERSDWKRMRTKARIFWPLLLIAFVSDCTTKRVAVEALSPAGSSREVLGETLRFTLAFNDGGAMGIPVGAHGRVALGLLGLGVVVTILVWYLNDPPTQLCAS